MKCDYSRDYIEITMALSEPPNEQSRDVIGATLNHVQYGSSQNITPRAKLGAARSVASIY